VIRKASKKGEKTKHHAGVRPPPKRFKTAKKTRKVSKKKK
jgi:hypothetical protein